ncbi:MAG: hypothetical protein DMG07_27885 [Acidobacteria bacterium]|nr:MAG: hypothetical protein DMG07_27885 [Acidobacteriota bacterium]
MWRWLFIVICCVCTAATPAPKPPPAQTGENVFFAFDDHAIPWHYNTKVTLLRAEKHPANPVLRTGPPGSPDHGHAILYGSVLPIGGKFRMWYLGMIERELKSGQAWHPLDEAGSRPR